MTKMTTKLQIRAPEEMFPSYGCGIDKTSSQMRTPDLTTKGAVAVTGFFLKLKGFLFKGPDNFI